jgi:Uma2 family endonuclease
MATTVQKLSYSDDVKVPADGFRHEIIEGEEFRTPAPEVPHQRAVSQLVGLLNGHARKHRLGDVFPASIDVILAPEDIVQPDVIFVSASNAGRVTLKNIQGAPDLVLEVLSPSTASVARGPKLALCERTGVIEVWIADPASGTMEIHEFGSPRRTRVYKDDQSFETAVLPGLSVRLSDIFLVPGRSGDLSSA